MRVGIGITGLCVVFSLTVDARAQHELSRDFPPQLVQFEPHSANPVFTAGESDDWDAAIRERGWILRDDQQYRMWYTGYDGTRPGQKKLGYATSADGIHWKRWPTNPVYSQAWIEDMMVVRDGGLLHMFAEGRDDQPQLLTSRDGVNWQRKWQLDVRLKDGSPIPAGPYGTPTVWKEGPTWYLFYERRDAGIWLAKSTDARTWVNVRDEPVLLPGPQEFDRLLVAMNQIVRVDDRYYALYHGSGSPERPRLWASGIAVSDDLLHWTKYAGNPLRPSSENKSSGILVHDGRGWRFYTMHARVDLHVPTP